MLLKGAKPRRPFIAQVLIYYILRLFLSSRSLNTRLECTMAYWENAYILGLGLSLLWFWYSCRNSIPPIIFLPFRDKVLMIVANRIHVRADCRVFLELDSLISKLELRNPIKLSKHLKKDSWKKYILHIYLEWLFGFAMLICITDKSLLAKFIKSNPEEMLITRHS